MTTIGPRLPYIVQDIVAQGFQKNISSGKKKKLRSNVESWAVSTFPNHNALVLARWTGRMKRPSALRK